MAAAIYLACRHHAEPSTAIEEAVNAFGSDTDSIAAFAGGILGALHGENAIPERWCGIQDRSYIQMLAKRIAGHDHTEKAPRKNFPLNTETGLDLVSDYPDKIIQGMRCWLSPLGSGTITTVDRQRTLTKGRYNLILDVAFDIGQTCRIAKLFTDS
jgi:hypothetical protein